MDPYSISQCSACGKSYSNDANLRKHIRRQPLCAKWNAMKQSGSKSFVDDQMWGEVNKTQTEIDMEIVTEIVCPTCGEKYSNMGNLNRHLNASVVCRKWIVYNDVNGIEQYISKWANPSAMVDPSTSLVDLSTSLVDPSTSLVDPSTSLVEEHDKPLSSSSPSPTIATSPPLKGMLHIIWNLFLTDRESAGQNLVEMVDSNGVQLIIAMLPDLKHFVADTVDRANFGAVRKDYIDQVLVNVLMMAKPDFFERLRYDPTPTKDSTAGDVFNCDPATNKWVVINRIAIQYYLMKKVVPMADLTTEEVDYLFDNNSAVKDIIERLVCEVQSKEMSSTTKLDSGFMKKISGGSNVGIAGRKCGKGDMFEYIWQSGVLCVFNENQFPSMDVTDKASIARIMVAPMRSKFVDLSTYTPEAEEEYVFDTDTNLHLKFNDWRSAMMDVMVERYVDDRERLFSSLPESMGNWKADVLGSANPMSEWLSEVLVVTGNSSDFVTGGYLKTEWVSAHGVQGKGSGITIPLINAYIEGVNKAEKDPSKRVIICGAGSSNVVVENNRITTKRHVYKGIAFKPLHDEIVY
eukprot:gene2859-4927_t